MGFNFKGVTDAKINSRGQHLSVGEHELEVKKVICKAGGFKGDSIIVEATVTKSGNEKDPVGATRTAVFNVTKNPTMAWANAKQFVYAAHGLDVSNEAMVKAADEDKDLSAESTLIACEKNPDHLAGRKVMAQVIPWTTKDKKDITVTNFRAVNA